MFLCVYVYIYPITRLTNWLPATCRSPVSCLRVCFRSSNLSICLSVCLLHPSARPPSVRPYIYIYLSLYMVYVYNSMNVRTQSLMIGRVAMHEMLGITDSNVGSDLMPKLIYNMQLWQLLLLQRQEHGCWEMSAIWIIGHRPHAVRIATRLMSHTSSVCFTFMAYNCNKYHTHSILCIHSTCISCIQIAFI